MLFLIVFFPIIIGFAVLNINRESETIREDRIRQCETMAEIGAVTVGQVLESAIDEGILSEEQVFDTSYVPIPNSNPPRYHTAYDEFTDRRLQRVLDGYLNTEMIVFAVAVDRYGYIPTHNTIYTQGNVDDPRNRTKQMFEDKARLSLETVEKPQREAYRQDSGETLWDIFAPIYVRDIHWGAFHVGISIEQIDREIAAARNSSLLGLGFILLVLVITVLLAASTVVRPIEILRRAVEKTGNGDFSHRVSIGYCTELQSLSKSFNQMAEKLDHKTKTEWMQKAALKEANTKLQQMVVTDELTSVHSRKYLFVRLIEEIAAAQRTGNKLSVIFFDIDGFKHINDRYGHRAGDMILVHVVNRIRALLRPYDVLARYGGDEFVILIPGTTQAQVREAAERIREQVSGSVFEVEGNRLKVTLSIGTTTLDRFDDESPEKTADRLLSEADERLYQAKRRGRNCVV
ncbi:MAG: GGDEF domain-containing protein [Desulforudis sp.]|nr:MAG: GGDEF domain-containing protein [Desulforudis sp.]